MSLREVDLWFGPAVAVGLVPALTFLASAAFIWIAEKLTDGERNPSLVAQWPSLLLQSAVASIAITLEGIHKSGSETGSTGPTLGLLVGFGLMALTWSLLSRRSNILSGAIDTLRGGQRQVILLDLASFDKRALVVSFAVSYLISLRAYQVFFPGVGLT